MQLETVNNLYLIILANVKYKNYSYAVLFMYALQRKSIIINGGSSIFYL